MLDQNPSYQSFLLRIWRECDDGDWRYSLQDVFNGECFNFSNLYELYEKLCQLSIEGADLPTELPYEQFNPQFSIKVEKG